MATNAPINVKFLEGLRSMGKDGGPDIALTLIGIFNKNTPSVLSSIETSFSGKDYLQMARMAHKLKSSSTNVGAETLTRILSELEDKGFSLSQPEASDPNGTLLHSVQQLVEETKVEYQRVAEQLREFR